MKSLRLMCLALLTLIPSFAMAEVNEGYVLESAIWRSRDINVCWESFNQSNEQDRELVQEAIASTWERYSRVRFNGWEQCQTSSTGIRIRVEDDANQGPHTIGLGNQLDGRRNGMALNFTFINWGSGCLGREDECIEIIAIHEFGHALGFAHEHNRPDTPDDCLEEHDPQGTDGDILVGNWDENSVMNYCNPESWPGPNVLSDGDIETVQRFYRDNDLVTSNYDQLPVFAADYYLRINTDVARAYGRENYAAARQHWENHGKREGRRSAPGFHVKDYLALNDDVRRTFGTNYPAAINHFLNYGIDEGRRSTYSFSVRYYLDHHSDLRTKFGATNYRTAHHHWAKHGVNEGRRSHSDFYLRQYVRNYSDLSRMYGDWNYPQAWIHWHKQGRTAGRDGD